MPLVLGPTGFTRLAHSVGELAVARAAGAAGVPYTLSTAATCSIEAVAGIEERPDLWFQLYVLRDRALTLDLLQRARAQGYRVLVLAVDTPVTGDRRRDNRTGFSIPAWIRPASMLRMPRHPSWIEGVIDRVRTDPEYSFVAKMHTDNGLFADLERVIATGPPPADLSGYQVKRDPTRTQLLLDRVAECGGATHRVAADIHHSANLLRVFEAGRDPIPFVEVDRPAHAAV